MDHEGITSTYLSIKTVASLQLARSAVQAIQTSTTPYKMAAARNRTHFVDFVDNLVIRLPTSTFLTSIFIF